MLSYPEIDPVAFRLGPLEARWYGLMYAVSFLALWWLGRRRARRRGAALTPDQVDDFVLFGFLAAVAGGRIGYMLFYQVTALVEAPWTLLRVWDGGMSFHGGMLGAFVGVCLVARRHKVQFLAACDFIAPLVPIGLGLGRLGNFINGELWGKPTDLPWGMVFEPLGSQPRHPAMLYELVLEGVMLFVLLNLYARRSRPAGAITGLGLVSYGVFRCLVEFVRLPDAHLGYLAWGWLTMGQLLSLPMLLVGAGLMIWAVRRPLRRLQQA